jgi:hypothetical protein
VNDGDQDEKAEDFTVDVGYVVGSNEIVSLDFELSAEDGTNAESSAKTLDIEHDLTAPDTVANSVTAPSTSDHVVGFGLDGTSGTTAGDTADDELSSYTTTLIDSDGDGVIESITVGLGSIGKGVLNVVGTDSLGQKNEYD